MRELELKELESVSAGFALPGAVVGGAAGGAGYAGAMAASNQKPTAVGGALAVGAGAFAGFFGGPMGIQTAVNVIGATATGGVVVGGVTKMTDKSGSDYGKDGGDY